MRPGAGRERGPADGARLAPLAPGPRRGLPEDSPRHWNPDLRISRKPAPPPPTPRRPLHPPEQPGRVDRTHLLPGRWGAAA